MALVWLLLVFALSARFLFFGGFSSITLSSVLWWFGIAVLLCLLALSALYVWQEALLYQPKVMAPYVRPADNPPGYRSPREYDMHYEEVTLTTEDSVKLSAWLCLQKNEPKSKITVIYFHANAGNMGLRLPNVADLYHKLGLNVLLVSYRGYGDSEGTPSEAGLMLDARAALNYLHARVDDIDSSSLVVFGRSLGGAVAIYLASQFSDQISGVILENTFTSISDMVDSVFPMLRPLKSTLLRIDWPSHKRIPDVAVPILFISGDKDEIVPRVHMQRLYDNASGSTWKRMLRVPDGMHNDTWLKAGGQYLQTIEELLDIVRQRQQKQISAD